MSDIKSSPSTIARAMGWDFNGDTSPEALAAWEAYREIPLNTGTYASEQDAFTAGFDAAIKGPIEVPVVLPTVPGYYLGYEDADEVVVRLLKSSSVQWVDVANTQYLRPSYIAELTDLTLLRPVAEVATEVLAEVHMQWQETPFRNMILAISAKFGVVSK